MLSRRALLGSAAALSTGCGFLESQLSVPSLPNERPLTWAVTWVSDEELPWLAEKILIQEDDNPLGPKLGGYTLARRGVEDVLHTKELVDILNEMEADLVNVYTFNVPDLAANGALLPLDAVSDAEEYDLDQEFYPSLLDQFRFDGALYALPVNARPLVMQYDAALFAAEGLPPMDGSWEWEDLARTAEQLVLRDKDGTVRRWGLVAHNHGIWWALWQNGAEVADSAGGKCNLRDSSAIAALHFVRDLFHTHRVSPAATGRELWDNMYINRRPPVMMHSQHPTQYQPDYRVAVLPRGREQVAPISAEMGMAIVAKTPKPELAFTALRGLVDAMQKFVNVPAKRPVIARLGDIRQDYQEDEVAVIQQSLEFGRGLPSRSSRSWQVLDGALKALVRGDDITTAVNEACSLVH